jgi:hypothetical protein
MVWYLVGTLVVILLFLFFVGARVTNRANGILIDTRNKISLSQFQIVLWTWILLAGFFAIVIARMVAGAEDPLGVSWDERLWGLLGISLGSAVASGAVKSVKRGKEPKQSGLTTHLKQANRLQGLLVTNPEPQDASVWDMFRGEEPANYTLLDVGKVQMFLFTTVAALAYVVALFRLVATNSPEDITAMPTLSEGLVFILGISHAGYLGNKWGDKQPIEPPHGAL